MEKFMIVDKLGLLEIETVLVEMNEPVFFICKNEKEDLFLCSCCQSNKNGKKWLITRTSPSVIVKILKDDITLREAFLKFKDIQVSVCSLDGVTKITEHDPVDWDYENSIFLPDKEEYMDAEDDEFSEEISYYEGKKVEVYKDIKMEINEQIFEKMKIVHQLLESKFEIGLNEPKKHEFDYDNSETKLNEIRTSIEYPDCISRQGYMINGTGECLIAAAA